MPICELAECELGLPEGRKKFCCEKHARRHRQRKDQPEITQESTEADDLRSTLRRTQSQLARSKAKTADLIDAVYTAARDASLSIGKPEAVKLRKPTAGKGLHEVALLHTTDWQYGKLTETYDRAKCEERIRLLAAKVDLLTRIQRTEHPVDDIVVCFGGDMLEGLNIFPGQSYLVDSTLYTQLFGVVKLEQWLLRYLLTIFNHVTVVAEPGNHGRLGRKGDFARDDNTDLMSYEITRLSFANEPRLMWIPYLSWHQRVVIGNYTAMLIHGDEIKSFGGNTPAFGLLRKGTAWGSGVVEDFQDIYFGHYHTPMALTLPSGGTMYGTGSTESDNAYAAEFVAARGKPTQRLHYIDPRKGRVTCEYKIYLDETENEE